MEPCATDEQVIAQDAGDAINGLVIESLPECEVTVKVAIAQQVSRNYIGDRP